MSLKAGNLRHFITLETPKLSEDAYHGEEWTLYKKGVPAAFNFLSGKELFAAGAEHSEITARIQVRFDPNINAAMRVKFAGKLYAIHAVMPDNRSGREWLTLFVSEGVVGE